MTVMSADEIRKISPHYRTGQNDLRRDFFSVCFRHCRRYRRAAGYFSSSALLTWLSGLLRLVQAGDELKLELIISNELMPDDAQTLRQTQDPTERRRILQMAADTVVELILSMSVGNADAEHRAAVFGWLVANGHLEMKFAFPRHVDNAGIFHEKIGVFDFPSGERVAFTGSANESGSGHSRNYESIDVYRSWIPEDVQRVAIKTAQFDEAWAEVAEGLEVVPLSKRSLARILEIAPSTRPRSPPEPAAPADLAMWRHQSEAAVRFLSERRGILEMATGTGKTRTALKVLTELLQRGTISSAIISTDGTDLLAQWRGEMERWSVAQGKPFLVLCHFGSEHDLGHYAASPSQSVLVISRSALPQLMKRLRLEKRSRIAVVHDEVHGLGMPGIRVGLEGQHATFPFVLGLSATPDRTYDADGNTFIESEVGKVIFRFPIERAIARGILCEFDYEPLEYELTEGDRARLKQVYQRQAASAHSGRPMSLEDVWIELSKVYKTAEMKPAVFAAYLARKPASLKRSIVFVETREYAEQILEIIHQHTNLYRTYYADDDRENLLRFSAGEIDCLITCHRISQGIDIRSLRTVFLISSARAKLETVQRIGRCLRTDPAEPDKRALVVDFVRPQDEEETDPNADNERSAWLTVVARTRRGDEDGPE